jgi:hypothetical protein
MGQLSAVLDELESIGAVGEKVVLLRLEAPKAEPVVRVAPPPEEQPSAGGCPEFSERIRLVHEVCEESLQKLAIVAKQVQDLQRVFTQLLDVTRLEEGERDAQIHQEA